MRLILETFTHEWYAEIQLKAKKSSEPSDKKDEPVKPRLHFVFDRSMVLPEYLISYDYIRDVRALSCSPCK